MHWDLVKIIIEILASFFLFCEYRRLSKLKILCKNFDIRHYRTTSLSYLSLGLSVFFMTSFLYTAGNFSYQPGRSGSDLSQKNHYGDLRKAFVEKVIDGDTIQLSTGERVVYKGIDAHERTDQSGWIHKLYLAGLELNRQLVEKKEVKLETGSLSRDRYGRTIAYVFVEGTLANAELVHQGLAKAVNYGDDGRYDELLSRLEKGAKLSKRGIWKYTPDPHKVDTELIMGSKRSKIYHLPQGRYYDLVSLANRVYFLNEREAKLAGYRLSRY